MTSYALSGLAHIVSIRISIVPLTVQVVGHVNDIIDNCSNLVDRKCLKVPVRCRCCNRDRLSCANQVATEEGKEFEIVDTVVFLTDRLTANENVWSL